MWATANNSNSGQVDNLYCVFLHRPTDTDRYRIFKLFVFSCCCEIIKPRSQN